MHDHSANGVRGVSGLGLEDELDLLTWRAHEIDAFCNAWVLTWLMMEQMAQTAEQRAWCCYEVECWSKVRGRAAAATYADINRILRRHDD